MRGAAEPPQAASSVAVSPEQVEAPPTRISTAMPAKISKKAAEYIPAAEYMGLEFCRDCTMWIGPNGCTAVAGDIEAKGNCKLYVYSGGRMPERLKSLP